MNWYHLNWFDYAIIGIITISSLVSLIRGFVREALSLASWIIAFWVALTFNSNFAMLLKPYVVSDSLRSAAAFFILFVATLVLGSIINYLITTLVEKTGLSGTDRLLGIVFGFTRGVLLVAIILLVARVSFLPKAELWQQSQLIPSFEPVENWLSAYLPHDVQHNFTPGFKQLIMPEKTTPDSNTQPNKQEQPKTQSRQKRTADAVMLEQQRTM